MSKDHKARSKWHTKQIKKGRIAAALAGVKFGRKPKLSWESVLDIKDAYRAGMPALYLASKHGVSRSTISRIVTGATHQGAFR